MSETKHEGWLERNDEAGELDEVFISAPVANVHVERMDVGFWWLRAELADGRAVVLHFGSKRPQRTAVWASVEGGAGVSGLGFYRGRNSKFNARPTQCRQGVTHHSAMESARCDELHVMQIGGLIRDLEAHPQPRFDLDVNGVHVTRYLADFRYVDAETEGVVVEDVKGHATQEYLFKKRLLLAVHGIEVQEVRRVRGRR